MSAINEHLFYLSKSPRAKRLFGYSAVLFVLFFIWNIIMVKDFGGAVIPFVYAFVLNAVVIGYGCSQKASGVCISGVCILNYCAVMSQTSIGYSNGIVPVAVSLAGVLAVAWFTRRYDSKTVSVVSLVLMLLCLFACLFMPNVRGAHSWLRIAGYNIIQLTEVAKLCYVLFVGYLMMIGYNEHFNLTLIMGASLIAFAMLALFAKELGTIIIIGSSLFCFVLMKLKKSGYKLVMIFLVVIAIIAVVSGYSYVDAKMGRWKCPECQTVNSRNLEECVKCKIEMPVDGYNFKCSECYFRSWGSAQFRSDPSQCDMCKKDASLLGGVGGQFKKIYSRMNIVMAQLKDEEPVVDTYHVDHNRQAIKLGRWFGNTQTHIYVPEIETDSVIAGSVNRLGIIYAWIVLLAFFMIFSGGMKNANASVRILAVFVLCFQAFYTFFGTLNILPMTGVGVPLISRGGSNLLVSYALIYLMLTSKHNEKEVME